MVGATVQSKAGWLESLREKRREGASIAMAIDLGTSYFPPPLFCVKFVQRTKEGMWHDNTSWLQLAASSDASLALPTLVYTNCLHRLWLPWQWSA